MEEKTQPAFSQCFNRGEAPYISGLMYITKTKHSQL